MRTSSNWIHQKWFIIGTADGYMFRPECSSNKVLDLPYGNTTDGTPLEIYEKSNNSNQKFGIYIFEQPGQTTTLSASTGIAQVKFNWSPSANTDRYSVKIFKNKVWEGDPVKTYTTTGTEWTTTLPKGTYQAYVDSENNYNYIMSNVITINVENTVLDMGDNFSAMILHKGSGKPLMISRENDMRVVIGTKNSENISREIWNFIKNDDGSYKIKPYFNLDRCLEIRDCVDENHAEVKIYNDSDWIHQKWFILDTGDGVMLSPECTNTKVLDLPYGNTADGTPLELYDKSDNGNQKFTISKFNMPGQSTLTAKVGKSNTDTKFTWTATKDTTFYRVAIYKNKVWESDPVKLYDTTNTEWSTVLPEGTYQVYISAHNDYSYTMSNIVTIKVEKGNVVTTTSKPSTNVTTTVKTTAKTTTTTSTKTTTAPVTSTIPTGTTKPAIPGDLNGDGKIAVSDLVALQKYLLGSEMTDLSFADIRTCSHRKICYNKKYESRI